MELKRIIDTLHNSSKPISEHLNKLPKGSYLYTSELQKNIQEAIDNKNELLLESLLLIAQHDGLNDSYTYLLCQLLQETWEFIYEDIVMCLEEIKDPDSVDCIFQASFLELDYDDGKSLAKKCIWALGAINTPEALGKIQELSKVADPIIKEAALMELKRRTT